MRGVASCELLQESVPFGMESERVATRDRVCGRDAPAKGVACETTVECDVN